MLPLDSQIAVVTGAARGVGEAVSHKLASMGAHVVLVARDTNRLSQVSGQIHSAGGRATVLPCDLLDVAAVEALGQKIARDATSSSTTRASRAAASRCTQWRPATGT